LSNVTVKEGNIVQKGQEIGASGSTGLTTINGLGFTTKINGEFVNPEEILPLDFNKEKTKKN